MSDDPDVIRADIEATRRNLSGDVDALADKVTPSKIAQRQTRKVKGAFHSITDRIMGTAEDVASTAGGAVADAGGAVADAGRTVASKAQGNPLAVGLIAFGVGALVASLIPPSSKEQELASSAKEAAQPLLQEAAEVGKQMASDLKEPAQEAFQSVKETAQEGMSTVQEEASQRAGDVADDAKESGQRLQS
jgi:gas vesicle protein